MRTVSKRGIEDVEPGTRHSDETRGIEVSDQSQVAIDGDRADMPHQIERLITALPSTTWLSLAGASIAGSIALRLFGRPALGSFVGQLTPALLICGLYNKLTKVGAATALFSSRR